MKHSGFNKTLIVMDFKFTAEFLGQTEQGKRDNKGQFVLIYRLVQDVKDSDPFPVPAVVLWDANSCLLYSEYPFSIFLKVVFVQVLVFGFGFSYCLSGLKELNLGYQEIQKTKITCLLFAGLPASGILGIGLGK